MDILAFVNMPEIAQRLLYICSVKEKQFIVTKNVKYCHFYMLCKMIVTGGSFS